jgi:hypothetical protein
VTHTMRGRSVLRGTQRAFRRVFAMPSVGNATVPVTVCNDSVPT